MMKKSFDKIKTKAAVGTILAHDITRINGGLKDKTEAQIISDFGNCADWD